MRNNTKHIEKIKNTLNSIEQSTPNEMFNELNANDAKKIAEKRDIHRDTNNNEIPIQVNK